MGDPSGDMADSDGYRVQKVRLFFFDVTFIISALCEYIHLPRA